MKRQIQVNAIAPGIFGYFRNRPVRHSICPQVENGDPQPLSSAFLSSAGVEIPPKACPAPAHQKCVSVGWSSMAASTPCGKAARRCLAAQQGACSAPLVWASIERAAGLEPAAADSQREGHVVFTARRSPCPCRVVVTGHHDVHRLSGTGDL